MRPSRSGRRSRIVAVVAVAVLALAAGCSDGDDGAGSSDSGDRTTPTPGQDVRLAEQSVPHPQEGDCHDLTAAQVQHPNDRNEIVRCRTPHTTQTYYVGTFDLSIIGDRTPETADVAEFVTPRCTRRFNRWVGGDRETRILARAHPVWFVPTPRDIQLGARWFRCDLVLTGVQDRLAELPRNTEGLLESSGALDEYGLCSRGSPERPRSTMVVCGRSHSWQAFDTLRVRSDSDRYPSRKDLRDARKKCRERARAELDFPLKWTYGWQAPTREQWQSGLEWGVCWIPRD
jgi:Septum formation